MTYDTKDKSVKDGAPIECYAFVTSSGTWRYTSYDRGITVAGQMFTPLPIVRTAIETGSVTDSPITTDFILPVTSEAAKALAFLDNPKECVVTVYSVHEGDDYATDYRIEYVGHFAGASSSGKWATIKTGSILQTKLNGNLSSVFYQGVCNHILFDERCKIVRAAHTVTATVTKVQSQKITVDNDGGINGYLIGGEILNTRTGEKRGVISNTDNAVLAGYKFIDIIVGDTVELTVGCNHLRLGDCKNKFDNVDNYGGFDFIPVKNPFEQFANGTLQTVTTTVKRERTKSLVLYADTIA